MIKYRWISGIFSVLGLIAGIIYSHTGRPYYESTMLIKSNDSYLEENILNKTLGELNSMCNSADHEQLALLLNLPVDKTKELRSFRLLEEKLFDKTEYNYRQFLSEIKGEDDEQKKKDLLALFLTTSQKNNIYYIAASSHNPDVLPLLNEPIEKLFELNPYFVREREINKEA